MPPFIAFAGVLGGLAMVRWAYKTAQKINQELEEMRLARVAETTRASEIKTLRRDPVTGADRSVYPCQTLNPEDRARPRLEG